MSLQGKQGSPIVADGADTAERLYREATVLIVASDIPFPPVTGGRADVWTRIKALHASNVNVHLLCWYDAGRMGDPSPEAFRELRSVCREVRAYPIYRTFRQLVRRVTKLWRLPSHAAARVVATPLRDVRRWVQRLDIDAILLDGLYGGEIAKMLLREQRVPLLYRSHNVEHVYMKGQYRRERSLSRRVGLAANLLHLRAFEMEIMTAAFRVFDISIDDARFWANGGVTRAIEWVPPIVDIACDSQLQKDIDVLFFGNLHTPNNVQALRWFVLEVLPKCVLVRTVVLAGSNPVSAVRDLAHVDPRIELKENPGSMVGLIERSKVLVNPTQFSSGINIKSVEMLFSDACLVSTSAGVKGLPAEVQRCFYVHDEAGRFADSVNAGVKDTQPMASGRQEARRYFSPTIFPRQVLSAIADWRSGKTGASVAGAVTSDSGYPT